MQKLIDEFLNYCEIERQQSQHTLQAYGGDLADFCRWLPAGTRLEEINSTTMKEYLSDMVSRRNLSIATVRRRFACLRVFFRRLVESDHIQDPFAKWKLRLPRRKRLPRALSRPEVSSLVPSVDMPPTRNPNSCDPTLEISLQLMVSTGIRVGELCKIRNEDVSPDGTRIRILGKGSRDRIAYIVDTMLQKKLSVLIASRRERPGTEAFLLNRLRAPIRPQSIRSKLRRHAIKSGLTRKVTPHMLRHTAATLLIESGVDIRFVQRLLGHSSIATTEIYTHVSDEALKTTLERANILGAVARTH